MLGMPVVELCKLMSASANITFGEVAFALKSPLERFLASAPACAALNFLSRGERGPLRAGCLEG